MWFFDINRVYVLYIIGNRLFLEFSLIYIIWILVLWNIFVLGYNLFIELKFFFGFCIYIFVEVFGRRWLRNFECFYSYYLVVSVFFRLFNLEKIMRCLFFM